MLLNKSFEASRLNVLEAVSPVSLLVEEPYRAEKQISRRGSHTARGRERERERESERERERERETLPSWSHAQQKRRKRVRF